MFSKPKTHLKKFGLQWLELNIKGKDLIEERLSLFFGMPLVNKPLWFYEYCFQYAFNNYNIDVKKMAIWLGIFLQIFFSKSRIRETPTRSTDADSRTNTNFKRFAGFIYIFFFLTFFFFGLFLPKTGDIFFF